MGEYSNNQLLWKDLVAPFGLNHAVIADVIGAEGELSFLQDSNTRTHRNAHLMKPFFG